MKHVVRITAQRRVVVNVLGKNGRCLPMTRARAMCNPALKAPNYWNIDSYYRQWELDDWGVNVWGRF